MFEEILPSSKSFASPEILNEVPLETTKPSTGVRIDTVGAVFIEPIKVTSK